jgi:tRNA pseudouridine38-40 synthase
MRNIKLVIEYGGTPFAGWQIQPGKRTVQGTIQEILRRITQEKIHLIGASRTDAGVHALAQAANFRTKGRISCERLLVALNGLLPREIAVKEVREVPPSFHATRSAIRKTYAYLILNAPVRSALLKDRAWHVWTSLNLKAMRRAARPLLGRHDFSAFRGTRSATKTSVRTIYDIRITKKDSILRIEITANGFLKYMVRNIVGTLVEVGKGGLQAGDMGKILRSKDRKKAGVAAPASGLYLVKVDY